MLAYDDALLLHKQITDQATAEQMTRWVLQNIGKMATKAVLTRDRGLSQTVVTLLTRHFHSAGLLDEYEKMKAHPDGEVAAFIDLGEQMLGNLDYWAKKISRGYVEKVKTLPTVWISPSAMAEAAEGRSEHDTMPAREMLPFPEGCFIALAEPMTDEGQFYNKVHGMLYWPISDERAFLTSLSSHDPDTPLGEDFDPRAAAFLKGMVTPDMLGTIGYGEKFAIPDEDPVVKTLGDRARSKNQSLLTADILHLLTRQNTKREASMAVADASSREAKRAAKKVGLKPEVNVIYLREEKAKVIGGSGEGGHVSRHKVRAHWRWQPYGPGRKLRRWQLIPAHERGSGELDDRPKVYVEGRA